MVHVNILLIMFMLGLEPTSWTIPKFYCKSIFKLICLLISDKDYVMINLEQGILIYELKTQDGKLWAVFIMSG